jgi:hypothetical protein
MVFLSVGVVFSWLFPGLVWPVAGVGFACGVLLYGFSPVFH